MFAFAFIYMFMVINMHSSSKPVPASLLQLWAAEELRRALQAHAVGCRDRGPAVPQPQDFKTLSSRMPEEIGTRHSVIYIHVSIYIHRCNMYERERLHTKVR